MATCRVSVGSPRPLGPSPACRCCGPFQTDQLRRLDLEADLHLITNQEAASLERGIPVPTEVLPVDRRLGFECEFLVAPRILGRAEVRHRQDDRLGYSVDWQIAFDAVEV